MSDPIMKPTPSTLTQDEDGYPLLRSLTTAELAVLRSCQVDALKSIPLAMMGKLERPFAAVVNEIDQVLLERGVLDPETGTLRAPGSA